MTDKNLNMGSLQDSQRDMKTGYAYGSTGVLVSGIIWVISGLIVNFYSPQKGIWALLIGGAMIFPLSALMGKLMGIKGEHQKNNLLARLAMEGTIWMIMCIPLAYILSLTKTEWFFQGMLMIIGGRYLTFASIYGLRIYWVLGAALGLAAIVLFRFEVAVFTSALRGGIIKIVFGFVIYGAKKKKKKIQKKNRRIFIQRCDIF
ncbi:DUF7010 family protein [Chryseobacterium phocaeense]|uniref:DUF7010 family protein n=1 Tax=Chryseobacterium phocaeense TaxID=1816690 RepID=UPI001E4CD4F5|nr:hypothetical protein [Chryseobacterium phocaeense]